MKKRRLILFTLAFINFTHIVDAMLIMPLGDIFIEEFSISAQEYSLLVSAYAIAAFISSLFGIFLVDLFDRKKALLFLYGGFAIGTFSCALADSYILLISLRFGTGLFGGLIGALVLSIVSDLFPYKERGSAMGILMGAFSAASALGIPIGIYLAAQGEWQIPFRIIGILGAVISLFIFFSFPPLRQHLDDKAIKKALSPEKNTSPTRLFQVFHHLKITISNIISDRNQVNALLAGFVLVLAHFMIIPFISPYMIKNVGLSQMEITYQFFFGGLFTVVSSPIVGRLTDKIGVMQVFTVMMILSFIPTLLITHMEISSLVYAVSICTLFFVFGSGRMIPPQTIITAAAPASNRGSFMSLKSAMQQLGIAIASILSGLIVVINESGTFSNYNYIGYISIIIAILAIYMINKLKVAKGN